MKSQLPILINVEVLIYVLHDSYLTGEFYATYSTPFQNSPVGKAYPQWPKISHSAPCVSCYTLSTRIVPA